MTQPDRDFYTDKASKMFEVPYEEVTEEQRAKAKELLMDYLYCRSNGNPFSSQLDSKGCKIWKQ
jgi:DNA polymerase I-like protein with 3'-5' exonuclease and polymerase domains